MRLSIADTGAGMDKETVARALEPFFTTKGIGKGTGLGLSIVDGLMSQCGGALVLKSELGLGTNAELWLPMSAELSERVESTFATMAAELKAIGKVLLVEDEDLVRMSTADMLSDCGYEVVEAASAEEALVLLEREPHVDFLITDHLMTGMTGIDLAHAVREKRPGTPVLTFLDFPKQRQSRPIYLGCTSHSGSRTYRQASQIWCARPAMHDVHEVATQTQEGRSPVSADSCGESPPLRRTTTCPGRCP